MLLKWRSSISIFSQIYKFIGIQNMKAENLKHPFVFYAIVTIFLRLFIKIKNFPPKKENFISYIIYRLEWTTRQASAFSA